MKPVAYAMFRDDQFYDAIHPDEYIKTAGEYDTPLYTYTQPKELTEKEILECVGNIDLDYRKGLIDFAKAILLKASGEG